MSAVLTAPFLAAAGLLVLSGAAKLRAPLTAVVALAALGLPARTGLVRLISAAELALAAACALVPGRLSAVLTAFAFAAFAGVSVRLARRRVLCGCFGAGEAPASAVQALLSAALAAGCAAGSAWPPHGLAWVLERPPAIGTGLVVGLGGCVYAGYLVYTELPSAWGAWSATR